MSPSVRRIGESSCAESISDEDHVYACSLTAFVSDGEIDIEILGLALKGEVLSRDKFPKMPVSDICVVS